jgi:hypothetical protein
MKLQNKPDKYVPKNYLSNTGSKHFGTRDDAKIRGHIRQNLNLKKCKIY